MADGNLRLALLGDAALKLVLVEHGYEKNASRGKSTIAVLETARCWNKLMSYPGLITDIVGSFGSNANLEQVGRLNGIDALVNVNQRARVSQEIVAGTVEAVIGAVYLDGGIEHVPGVLWHLGLTPKLKSREMPMIDDQQNIDSSESTSDHDLSTTMILNDRLLKSACRACQTLQRSITGFYVKVKDPWHPFRSSYGKMTHQLKSYITSTTESHLKRAIESVVRSGQKVDGLSQPLTLRGHILNPKLPKEEINEKLDHVAKTARNLQRSIELWRSLDALQRR